MRTIVPLNQCGSPMVRIDSTKKGGGGEVVVAMLQYFGVLFSNKKNVCAEMHRHAVCVIHISLSNIARLLDIKQAEHLSIV